MVNGDQEDMNVFAVVGTVVEDLVDINQEDANKWFKCNNGNVVTSIAMTFGNEEFNQEDAIEKGNNNNADALTHPDFSNLPLPFYGITFFGIKGFSFFCVTFVAFYLLLT